MTEQVSKNGVFWLSQEIAKFKTGGILKEMKKGSKIYIKPENKGKFTSSAKAAGESVQEHAHKVVSDPDSTELQRKRAQFAINAKKWKH